jgi:TetR/AcrR family transcriptional repressor of nem operon
MYGHIFRMTKISNREKILTEGMRVVHQHGFANASVRDIVQAAGVPQGSFTNHFGSKEAFGLEIIDLYYANSTETMRKTLRNDELPPLKRIDLYIDTTLGRMCQNMRNGCLFGNFAAEATDNSEAIRARLIEIFADIEASFLYCLRAAVTAGELPPDFDCEEIAGFIVSSLQGANLLSKAYRDPDVVERFRRVLFSKVLR